MNKELEELKSAVRRAFTEYVRSEGCGCCRDYDRHNSAAREIGKLLGYDLYPEKDWVDEKQPEYNFYDHLS